MEASVYIESTIVSFLTARPSRNLATQAKQQSTNDWWEHQRPHFELFVSEIVIQEASDGDPEAARQRLEVLEEVPVLDLVDEVGRLAQKITGPGMIPGKYFDDALHVSVATTNGLDYLLIWNLTHIANATLRRKYESVIRSEGYEPPIICTPEELTAAQDEEHEGED